MSIFGRNSFVVTDVNVPTFEGYSCLNNGDLLAIQESYDDQLAVIEAIHTLDMEDIEKKKDVKQLIESGASQEEIDAREEKYETAMESMAGDVWARIKAVILKMWGKLKNFFKSVVRFFDGIVRSGKSFATKYERDLKGLKLDGFEFKMFKYTNIEQGTKADKVFGLADDILDKKYDCNYGDVKDVEKTLQEMDDTKDDVMDQIRGALVGGGSLDKGEYNEALFAHFRDGAKDSNDKEDQKVNISEIINTLKTSKALSTAQDAMKDTDKTFQKQITSFNKMEKDSQKKSEGKNVSKEDRELAQKMISYAQKMVSAFSESKNIALDYFRAWKQAVTSRNSAYKSVCIAAFRYKKK